MSVRASASCPSSCSGAMYWKVPSTVPAVVSGFTSVGSSVEPEAPPRPAPVRARPKSRSFAPVFVSTTFPGLRSRWTMPCLCATSSAEATCAPNFTTCSSGSAPFCSRSASDSPVEQLHHQEVRVALVPDVEERADVGVVEGGDGLRLALEALAPFLVLGERGGQDLDGDAALEAGVASPPHLAHPAGADRRRELVGPEPRPGLKGHVWAEYSSPRGAGSAAG